MANAYSTGAKIRILQAIIDGLLDGGHLCLFNSNITPADGDTAATYTAHECVHGGYARALLDNWAAAADDGLGDAFTTEDNHNFVATGTSLPESIYGIFILDVNGDLFLAEKIATGPVTFSAAGHSWAYQPDVGEAS